MDGICTEETPLNPVTLYGTTKVAAERAILESGNCVCYRFATGFGISPRMRLDLLVNHFCYAAKVNHSLIVYEADARRTFIHVVDMARSFIHALENYDLMRDQVYNVGDNSLNYTKQEIAEKILDHFEYYLHFASIGEDEDKRDYEVDYSKIRATRFEVTISMDKGIEQLLSAVDAVEIRSPYSNV